MVIKKKERNHNIQVNNYVELNAVTQENKYWTRWLRLILYLLTVEEKPLFAMTVSRHFYYVLTNNLPHYLGVILASLEFTHA